MRDTTSAGWPSNQLAKRHGLSLSKIEHKAQTAHGTIAELRCILAKPMTFMNLSGDSIAPLASFYKIPPERIIVLFDELDIPFGTLRLRKTGRSSGQKGMKHIMERMGTQEEIPPVRTGIGAPTGPDQPGRFRPHALQG
ncbi:MAG: aminoacyl-tRNA hydrolase [Ilumatobacteraceae bacterium]